MEKIREAAKYILENTTVRPRVALVLGSGLGELAQLMENGQEIDYADIPGFVRSTVPGHSGKLSLGYIAGVPCAIMQGRFHYYEGYSPEEIVLPTRVMSLIGAQTLILTNAAGGVNKGFAPGDLMLVTDHINFSGMNPLRGLNKDELGERFPDMSNAYNRALRELIQQTARESAVLLRSGVYAMMAGPSFETPAEIRMLRTLGADAVGMSTVPEVIAANHCGLNVAAISCITNMAAGVLDQPITHAEVLETGERAREKFKKLLLAVIEKLA